MAHDLSPKHASDDAHAHAPHPHAHGTPGRASAAGNLEASGGASSKAMFAGQVDWENLHDEEDPHAMEEAHAPGADEDAEGVTNDEGELDADSEHDDEEGMEAAPEVASAAPSPAPHAPASASGGGATHEGGQRPGAQPSASAAKAGGSRTYHINRAYRDGPYGGTAKYDVRVTSKEITMLIGIRLSPGKGVTKAQVAHVKNASQAIFQQKYDGRFKLTEIPYRPRPLRAKLRFGHANVHHKVALHKGGGRDNAANWFVKGDATTRAHEIGHLLGLKDEYADPASPKRKVYTDNSLMGNYYTEGIKTAKLKKRHGKTFAHDISRASGRRFTLSA